MGETITGWDSQGEVNIGIMFYDFADNNKIAKLKIIAPPIGGWFGTEEIKIYAVDNNNDTISKIIYVTINYVNRAPHITKMLPCNETISDTTVVFTWSAYDDDEFDKILFTLWLDGTKIYQGYDTTFTITHLQYGHTYTWILGADDGQDITYDTCQFSIVENTPPSSPEITGVSKAIVGNEYTINIKSADNEGHFIFYKIDWGDNTIQDFTGPYESGKDVNFTHIWNTKGDYTIKVVAKDNYEAVSDTSEYNISIVDTGIYILNPQGGDKIESNSSIEIKVLLAGLIGSENDCELYYSIDNQQTWSRIPKNKLNLLKSKGYLSGEMDTLIFNWTVPDNVNSSTSFVKAIWIPNPIYNSISGMFTILPHRKLTLTYPLAGSLIESGKQDTIKWNSQGLIDKVTIALSYNNGLSYQIIADNIDNNGNFIYTWPDTNANYCYIKIYQSDDESIYDIKGEFHLYYNWINIKLPDKDAILEMTKDYNIYWDYNGIIEKAQILFISPYDTLVIANSVFLENKTFKWRNIPDDLQYNDSSRIIIKSLDYETSDTSEYFKLIPLKKVMLISPNGGEFILVDSNYTIKYEATYGIENIKLEYWYNNKWNLIVDNYSSENYTYTWKVPDIQTKYCKIKITGDEIAIDTSDEKFSISKPLSIKLLHPDNDTLIAGTTDSIMWETTGLIEYILIEYLGLNDTSEVLLNSGKQYFPVNWYNGNLKIRIKSIGLPSIFNVSDSSINVVKLPKPEIITPEEDSTEIYAGEYINFQCKTINNEDAKYYWDFGNGITKTGTSPEPIQYKTNGIYNVKVWYTVNNYTSETTQTTIKVKELPSAKILQPENKTNSILILNPLYFKGQAFEKEEAIYHWDFGDGTYSNELEPGNKIFTKIGNFKVKFWFVFNNIASDTDYVYVNVNNLPPATILSPMNDTSIVKGDSIHLIGTEYDKSQNPTYYWKINNKIISQQSDAGFYTFNDTGAYTITYYYTIDSVQAQEDTRIVNVLLPLDLKITVKDTITDNPCEESKTITGIVKYNCSGTLKSKSIMIDGEQTNNINFIDDTTFQCTLSVGQHIITCSGVDSYGFSDCDTIYFQIIKPQDSVNITFHLNGNDIPNDSISLNKEQNLSILIETKYPETFEILMGTDKNNLQSIAKTNEQIYNIPISFMEANTYYIKAMNIHSCQEVESNILTFKLTSTTDIQENIKNLKETTLMQNFPNPFNSTTKISFYLNKAQKVQLSLYNVYGQLIKTFIDKELHRGTHHINFNANNLPSGVYFIRLYTKDKILQKKITLIK